MMFSESGMFPLAGLLLGLEKIQGSRGTVATSCYLKIALRGILGGTPSCFFPGWSLPSLFLFCFFLFFTPSQSPSPPGRGPYSFIKEKKEKRENLKRPPPGLRSKIFFGDLKKRVCVFLKLRFYKASSALCVFSMSKSGSPGLVVCVFHTFIWVGRVFTPLQGVVWAVWIFEK